MLNWAALPITERPWKSADYRDVLGATRNIVLYGSPIMYIGWNVTAYARIGTRVILGDAYFEEVSEDEVTIFQPYLFPWRFPNREYLLKLRLG